ncbi:putative mitochondrial carrier protein [Aspergillus saccharolyticus JOP 1030-1]|uniref:Mitochondrial glycine transporter n=1 Tax=Aspergillus saccharolyticus JOP 1030-1 TaxID=1450539 RepID=A0A318Z4U2_9EURO|nr:mitochondrial carrier [Aspergillus saccharolyticus JOP 1030-1]PYH42106.1 mitochondrial carrier [Aspergillus saccharolyticus JOP 1030-1]
MSDNASYAVTQVKTTSSPSKTTFHFAAGLCSGLTSSILLQPADLLKTRIQQSQSASLLPTLKAILSSPHPIRGLWRGTLPSALRTGFGSALYFTSLNSLRQGLAQTEIPFLLASPPIIPTATSSSSSSNTSSHNSSSSALPKLSNSANLATGAAARVAAGFVMMPVTVLKVRYESDFYAYRSLASAGRDIVRTEGVRGLFSGFGATAARDAPYAGLYVLFYEQLKRRLAALATAAPHPHAQAQNNGDANGPVVKSPSSSSINFVSGGLAAGLATAITNPFDAVKTRLQLMPGRYGNMMRAARLMVREDGVRSLFGGLGLRITRKALSSALAWTVYEELILRAEVQWAAQGASSRP